MKSTDWPKVIIIAIIGGFLGSLMAQGLVWYVKH